MKIKYIWMFLFLIFVRGEISNASDPWPDFSSYLPTSIKTLIFHEEKLPEDPFTMLPNCFKRTNYLPQPYFLDNGSISDFDLSPAHVKEMKKHWKYLQKVINTPDSDFGAKKNDLIMDLHCQLAKEGYAPVFEELHKIFRDGKYGQRPHRKLENLFADYSIEVWTIGQLREKQKRSKRLMLSEEDFAAYVSTIRNSNESTEEYEDEDYVDDSDTDENMSDEESAAQYSADAKEEFGDEPMSLTHLSQLKSSHENIENPIHTESKAGGLKKRETPVKK